MCSAWLKVGTAKASALLFGNCLGSEPGPGSHAETRQRHQFRAATLPSRHHRARLMSVSTCSGHILMALRRGGVKSRPDRYNEQTKKQKCAAARTRENTREQARRRHHHHENEREQDRTSKPPPPPPREQKRTRENTTERARRRHRHHENKRENERKRENKHAAAAGDTRTRENEREHGQRTNTKVTKHACRARSRFTNTSNVYNQS